MLAEVRSSCGSGVGHDRYVSRPVRPYLRSFCGDFESVGDEDKRRRAIVRLMRIEKLETAPEALLRKK